MTSASSGMDRGAIEGALMRRAAEIRRGSNELTLKKVRRLMETDLGLPEFSLDEEKKFIGEIVDKIVHGGGDAEGEEELVHSEKKEEARNEEEVEEEIVAVPRGGKQRRKRTIRIEDEEDEEHEEHEKEGKSKEGEHGERRRTDVEDVEDDLDVRSGSESDEGVVEEEEEEEEGIGEKRKGKQLRGKGREAANKRTKSQVKRRRTEEEQEEEKAEELEISDDSEEGEEEEAERRGKKKAKTQPPAAAPPRSKEVERLKSILSAIELRVPPIVYKRAKQAEGSQYNATLIRELEAVLKSEGLSAHPSGAEIKAAKARRRKAKELEGLDTSNIIDEPRGRRSRGSGLDFGGLDSGVQKKSVYAVDDESEDEDEEEEDDDDDDDDEEEEEELESQEEDD